MFNNSSLLLYTSIPLYNISFDEVDSGLGHEKKKILFDSMKARIGIYEIFQKFKYFSNNILGVPHKIIFSKYNEYDFLTSINV